MKKTKITASRKLLLGKENVMVLEQRAQVFGGATEASACHSCMSKCLCDLKPTVPGPFCCINRETK